MGPLNTVWVHFHLTNDLSNNSSFKQSCILKCCLGLTSTFLGGGYNSTHDRGRKCKQKVYNNCAEKFDNLLPAIMNLSHILGLRVWRFNSTNFKKVKEILQVFLDIHIVLVFQHQSPWGFGPYWGSHLKGWLTQDSGKEIWSYREERRASGVFWNLF